MIITFRPNSPPYTCILCFQFMYKPLNCYLLTCTLHKSQTSQIRSDVNKTICLHYNCFDNHNHVMYYWKNFTFISFIQLCLWSICVVCQFFCKLQEKSSFVGDAKPKVDSSCVSNHGHIAVILILVVFHRHGFFRKESIKSDEMITQARFILRVMYAVDKTWHGFI